MRGFFSLISVTQSESGREGYDDDDDDDDVYLN
jgi:hypothetical protein